MARLGEALSRILTAAAASAALRTALILAVGLAVFLPGQGSLPVTDRDEGRFVQASKQMVETGDLIDIRFQDQPRWKKPAGIYWLQAGTASLAGGAEAPIRAYRLPSLAGALLAALLAAWAAVPLIGARGAALAGLMTATTVLVAVEAHIAKTDAVLMASAVAVFGALARLWLTETAGRWTALVLWLALTVSILVKGPIVPAVLILTILAYWALSRRRPPLGRLRAHWGLPLTALIVAPWLIAIWQISDGAFFAESLGRDLGDKLIEGQEKHWGPPGLYAALVWGTFWPWAAMLVLALPWAWRRRDRPRIQLLAAWVLPFWLVLEVVPTKLPHYVLPLYAPLAVLVAAWALSSDPGAPRRWQRIASAVLVLLPGVGIGLGLIVLPLLLEGRLVWAAAALGLAGIAATLVAGRAAFLGMRMTQTAGSLLAAMALIPAALGVGLPSLSVPFPSPRMAEMAARFAPCAEGPLISVGYREPSLVFLTETGTQLLSPDDAAAALANEPGRMLLVEDWLREALEGHRGAEAETLVERGRLDYFNYNRGRMFTARLLTTDSLAWDACAG